MTPSNVFGTAGLLRAAALLIKSRQPASQVLLTYRVSIKTGADVYLVQFSYPGVVSVFLHDTGELIVRSRPGRPEYPEAVRAKRRRGLPR